MPESATPVISSARDLFVKRIVLEGNTVFSDEELRPLVAPHEGKARSVEDLENLRQQLSRLYIDNGYINSGATIPQNGFVDGILHFRFVEGRLSAVRLRGEERLRAGYITHRLKGDTDQPLNKQDLQDRFQKLLSDPLIGRMNGRLVPGSFPGQSVLDLNVVRARPYHLSIFGDNYRPAIIGGEAFGVSGWLRNLTGIGDMLDFTYVTSSGSEFYSGGFSFPIGDMGTQAFFHFDEGDSYVYDPSLAPIGFPSSKVHSLEGGVSHAFIDKVDQRFSMGISLAIRENETRLGQIPYSFILGQPVFEGRNQATVWRLFQEYVRSWDRHAVSFKSTFNVGMNALGATPERDIRYQDSEYFSWLGQTYYAFNMMDNGAQWVMRGSLQLSNEPLLPLEQFAIGGSSTVRGYRENTLVKDEGYNFSMEFQYPLFGEHINSPNRFVLIPFVDYGRAWNHGGLRNYSFSNRPYEEIYSVGLGFNWQLKPVSADFYWGHAFKPTPVRTHGDLQDDGIHFQVRLDIL